RGHLAPWAEWSHDDHVHLTDGEVVNYRAVEAKLIELAAMFNITELVYDPRFAEELTQRVEEATSVERISFKQSWENFGAPTDEFERGANARTTTTDATPVTSLQVGHTRVRHSFTRMKGPCKPGDRSDHRAVDGSVAAVMALARVMLREPVYESMYSRPESERP